MTISRVEQFMTPSWLCSFKIIHSKYLQFYLTCKAKQQQSLPVPVKGSCVPSYFSLHFIQTTPKYTAFPFKWYTVIHMQVSHRNYYVYNTLLTKLSYVNEHLGKDVRMTAQQPHRPTPMPPGNGRQHARVIMNQCIRNCTSIRITFTLKNTAAFLFTENTFVVRST
jgi:hypothetical protein